MSKPTDPATTGSQGGPEAGSSEHQTSGSLAPDEARRLALGGELDYGSLGFRCGLEIHQQLDTRKLFSPCPSAVLDPGAVAERSIAQYDRRLRATQSELGETDPAALAEAKKRRAFRYLALEGLVSLVELDEEPPHPMSEDALDVALTFAGLLGSRPAAEVHVMRKTVIDGSNTSGFQRTALIATGGRVDVEDDRRPADGGASAGQGGEAADVGIWTIALEEDSARKLGESEGWVTYTLDRLGIPLIEVATAPDIRDPDHAKATAARLGALLRATGRVKRGLGTIRQDLNVSVGVGDRVEIKGCQDLRAVPRVIEHECRRQLWLHHVRQELSERGFQPGDVGHPVDVTAAFQGSTSQVVRSALKRKGKVLGLALPKWAGLIRGGSDDGPRMGREFADHAKRAAGVRGVFHSDELPAYGITADEVHAVGEALGLGTDDAFVLCVEKEQRARQALEAVAERAVAALDHCPREVRVAQPDDTTAYMRPLPGAARMYPETDVPPTRITTAHWEDVLARLPPRPEEKVGDYIEAGLSREIATQLVREGADSDFDDMRMQGVDAALAARVLLQVLPGLDQADAVRPRVPEVAAALADGAFAKEAVPAIMAAFDEEPGRSLADAVAAAGAEAVDDDAVAAVIDKVVTDRMDFVKERGMAAMGPLMGPVMAQLRGKADGSVISAKLKARLQEALA